jgi:hypothetical protein
LRKKTHRSGELISQVRKQAKERADELARQVPWQVLLEARNQYLEWQEFYYWARSIMEAEGSIPGWLFRRLDEMCPGFVAAEQEAAAKHLKDAALTPIRLAEWIEEHIFAFAERGGWLPAVTFYAVREPRYQRASACWSESVEKWQRKKPQEYPSLEQWLGDAAQCDESAHLLPEIRKQRECFKLVDPARLEEAVSHYIDWEALAYWARPALEQKQPMACEVARELLARCPGFAESNAKERTQTGELAHSWERLMRWIRNHFFQEAMAEGWYDAIVLAAGIHPRAIRTREYADHCDDIWNAELPVPYPTFESWRRDADRYVDLESP